MSGRGHGVWFSPTSISKLTPPSVYARGLSIFLLQGVRSLHVRGVSEGHWVVEGEVQGTAPKPYHTEVHAHLDEAKGGLSRWWSVCSCPVQHDCKHAVALLLKAAYAGGEVAAGSVQGEGGALSPAEAKQREQAARQERARQLAQRRREERARQALAWLQLAPDAAQTQPAAGVDAQRPKQPLYVLDWWVSRSGPRKLVVQLWASTPRLKGPGWTRARPAELDDFVAPWRLAQGTGALTPDDRDLLQLMRALPVAVTGYGSAPTHWLLDGPAAEGMLPRMAGTQRLFWRDEGGGPGLPLRWGPAQPLSWQWVSQAEEEGHEAATEEAGEGEGGAEVWWRPEPRLPEPELALAANEPALWYVHTTAGLVGPVQAQAEVARRLLAAPPLPQRLLLKHPNALRMQLQGVVEPPPVLPQLAVVGGAPRWRLTVMRWAEVLGDPQFEPLQAQWQTRSRARAARGKDPASLVDAEVAGAWEHLAQQPPQRSVVALLRFDYQGVCGLWPLDALPLQSATDARGAEVLVQREVRSERAAHAALQGLQLVDVGHGVWAAREAGAGPWLGWADEDYRVLREAGFELTLAPSVRGLVRHAQRLDAGLRPAGAAAPQGTRAGSGAEGAPGAEDAGDAEGGGAAAAGGGSGGALSQWFDLSLGLEVDGQRLDVLPMLPALIEAMSPALHAAHAGGEGGSEEGDEPWPGLPPWTYLPAPDGVSFVRVATRALAPWVAALLELFDGAPAGETARLSRLQAMRFALGEGVQWDGAPALRALAQQLKAQGQLPEVPVPSGLQAQLWPHQRQGLNWLQFLRAHGLGGILADDMGLGKTLQTLAHIQCEYEAGRLDRPALVIAPVSLMGNWQREAARFCPGLRTLVWHGAQRRERAAELAAAAQLVIAPYSLLHRDRALWLEQPWHLVVLDEAQHIKNASTQAAQVVTALQARHRLCLSGTPIENHLGEMWSLFHFLMPGFLGSQAQFVRRYRTPIEKHGDRQRLQQLRARLTPFILRRTKASVAHELPPKVESVWAVQLQGKQADLYETIRLSTEQAVRAAIAEKGLARSQIVFLDALLKLRQVCCHPGLVKLPAAAKVGHSAKLERLMAALPEMLAEGRRVLLFSQFTSMLGLIEAELKRAGIAWVKLTGQTQKRDEVIERFTRGEVPLFLISLKAGGVGLNLPQADTVIHFDPWWNPAAEQQATDRAHRIGQTQSVWVIKMVAQGTIEERILALQARKAQLAQDVYSGSSARAQPLFTEEDVRELLKPMSAD